jgi:hypothetical protein
MEFTICTECKNLGVRTGPAPIDTWHRHYCLANPVVPRRDPFDGEWKPNEANPTAERYQNCRYINQDGNCPDFEREEQTW